MKSPVYAIYKMIGVCSMFYDVMIGLDTVGQSNEFWRCWAM